MRYTVDVIDDVYQMASRELEAAADHLMMTVSIREWIEEIIQGLMTEFETAISFLIGTPQKGESAPAFIQWWVEWYADLVFSLPMFSPETMPVVAAIFFFLFIPGLAMAVAISPLWLASVAIVAHIDRDETGGRDG